MYSIQCSRCGKGIISSKQEGLCVACQNRRANGQRLAAERKEELAWDAEEERKFARREYADIFNVPLSDVPSYIGTTPR